MSLHLQNVRTFDRLELDLPEGACSIIGTNGAGKSTLVTSIDVALFGPESRTLADWLSEDRTDDTLTITLYFEQDGEQYRARRTYNGKGRGQSKFDLEHAMDEWGVVPGQGDHEDDEVPITIWHPLTCESMDETQAELQRIIGLTRETFRASSFIAAGTLFCDLARRDQKRLLGELLNLGQWETWLEQARKEKRHNELRLAETEALLERAEDELAGRDNVLYDLALAQNQEESAGTALESATARFASAREALAEARRREDSRVALIEAERGAQRAVDDLRLSIAGSERDLAGFDERLANRARLQEMADLLPELEAERETLCVRFEQWQERQRLEAEHARLMAESEMLRRQVDALTIRRATVLEGVGSEKCDRCQQVLGADAAERAAESYANEANELAFRANNIEEHDLVRLNEQISALPTEAPDDVDRRRYERLPQMIQVRRNSLQLLAALDEVEASRARIVGDLEKMRAELPDRERFAADALADVSALGPHDPKVIMAAQHELERAQTAEAGARFTLDQARAQIARLQERLDRLDTIAAEAETARDRRDALHGELDLLTNLERACGPAGVPTLILENVAIPQIETAANEILSRFGSKALGLELLTQAEKKTGGLKDTLVVNVLTEHGSRDYKTFSTGERLRINAAVTLAIAQLVAARSAHTGILVIDDLGPLDSQGMAVLVEICNDLAQRVGRVYVISQASELRDAFEQSIQIENVDGHSRIVGAEARKEIAA